MNHRDTPEDRGWMISEVATVPGVRHVVVFTPDGLLLASSEGMDRDAADKLAATCSGLQSLGHGVGRTYGEDGGAVHQLMLEYQGGFLFVRNASGAHLAVVTGGVIDPALIAKQMQAQVLKIGSVNLSSPPRQDPAH